MASNSIIETFPHEASNNLDELPLSPQEALPIELQTYYRPKTFSTTLGANPLVAAAAALLSLLARFSEQKLEATDLNGLQQQLIHELKAFCSAAERQGYTEKHIFIARYLLCVALDDSLLHVPQGHRWKIHRLCTHVLRDAEAEQRIFSLLEFLQQQPQDYIDILELAHLSLNLGFQGPFRQMPSGQQQHDQFSRKLYQLIRNQRDKVIEPENTSEKKQAAIIYAWWHWPAITFIALGLLYIGFNYVLRVNYSPLTTQIHQLTQQIDHDHADY